MHLSAYAAVMLPLILVPAILSQSMTVTVSYDTLYDNPNGSVDSVACSNGQNGLEKNGWYTFDQIPTFPFIGGSFAVSGWGSSNCGTCWELSYGGNTITVLAIDYAAAGFNIALSAMNNLTDGQAVDYGRVNATATQVPVSECSA